MKKIIIVSVMSLLCTNLNAQNSEYKSSETCPFQIMNYESITNDGERYTLPKISPDGTKIMFTKSNKQGVYIIDLKNREQIKKISEEHIYGDKMKWSKDGSYIIYKTRGNKRSKTFSENFFKYSFKENKIEVVNSINEKEKQIEISLNVRERKVEAFDGTNRWFITKEPGSYYNFVISPDNSKVIIKSNHINIYSINGGEVIDTGLERGIATDWSPDGKYFLYYIEVDDGHTYLESDLYVCSIDGKNKWKLTTTNDIMEARPSWSVTGEKLTFFDYSSGKIFIADLKIK